MSRNSSRWFSRIMVAAAFGIGSTFMLGASVAPSLIITNARVWTANHRQPWAEAVAVDGNQIRRVGPSREVAALAGKETRVIDAGGKFVMPGFNDGHIHIIKGGWSLLECNLTDATGLEEIQQRLRKYAAEHPKDQWIVATGWNYASFPGGRLPTKEDIDAAIPDRPVYMRAYDGHTVCVNSLALKLCRVTRDTKFDGFGEIVFDPKTGEPTGVFKEGATTYVDIAVSRNEPEGERNALRLALPHLASLGITSVQLANGNPSDLALYREFLDKGELTVRITMAMSIKPNTPVERIDQYIEVAKGQKGPMLRAGSAKLFLDGVIESHTAAMLEPYSDMPGHAGSMRFEPKQYFDVVARCDRGGLQIYTHAIGDRAVRVALDTYEQVLKVNGPHDARFRVEHIETVSEQDLPRFKKLGVLASMMPIHADPTLAKAWAPPVGPQRERLAFAWRSLEEAGAMLVFGSDWRATISEDPIRGLHNAVNRRTTKGEPAGGWVPQQRISVESALRAYTCNAAYSSFEEKIKGRIQPGMLADLVILSQNPFEIDPMDIHKTRVVMTVFDGRVIYQR